MSLSYKTLRTNIKSTLEGVPELSSVSNFYKVNYLTIPGTNFPAITFEIVDDAEEWQATKIRQQELTINFYVYVKVFQFIESTDDAADTLDDLVDNLKTVLRANINLGNSDIYNSQITLVEFGVAGLGDVFLPVSRITVKAQSRRIMS